jgi:hypothetical protein
VAHTYGECEMMPPVLQLMVMLLLVPVAESVAKTIASVGAFSSRLAIQLRCTWHSFCAAVAMAAASLAESAPTIEMAVLGVLACQPQLRGMNAMKSSTTTVVMAPFPTLLSPPTI